MSQAYVCDSCNVTIGKTEDSPARTDVNVNIIQDQTGSEEPPAVNNGQSILNKNLTYCATCFASDKVVLPGLEKPDATAA